MLRAHDIISAHGGCASDHREDIRARGVRILFVSYQPITKLPTMLAHEGWSFDFVEYVRKCCSIALLMFGQQYIACLIDCVFAQIKKSASEASGMMPKRWHFRAKQENCRSALVFVSAKPTTFSEKAV